MSSASRTTLTLLGLALGAGMALPAHAVEPLDTFSVRVSGYLNRFDTDVRADGNTARGNEINLKRDLGLDDNKAIAYIGATWRPFDHHEFGIGYYRNDLDNTRQLQRQFEFNDTLYEANAVVRAEYDFKAYELNYVWWAASHENWALGPRLGLVWYSINLGLSVQVDSGGNQVSGSRSNEVSADLPAPTIGGSWRWSPADQWRISADVGYFSANVQDVDADVTFGRAGVEWYPWERFGFSLDYTLSHIDAQAEKNNFRGNFDFQDAGVRFGVAYRF